MFKRSKDPNASRLADYRQAEAIEPDPARRATTSLIALAVVVSLLVLADTITYAIRPGAADGPPIVVTLVELPGEEEDEDRGEQKIQPEEEPEPPPAEGPPEQPEAPPAPAVVEAALPPGPADVAEPSDRPGIIATEGPGAPPRALFSNRGANARAKALAKYGGSARTENAVHRGLRWLARHQDEDGRWSRGHFERHCARGKKCGGAGFSRVELDPAVTGLALLAFCAANHTHRDGEYKANVAAAVKYLRSVQTKSGLFGDYRPDLNYYMMYNHGIATFALAELCAMTGDPAIQETVEKAVGFLVISQQPSGAWDYRDAKTGRYDTSVTGWQVMALRSAHTAGVEVPYPTVYRMAAFLDRVTLPSGEVIYSNMAPAPGRRGQGMAAVGMASNQFLGLPVHSRTVERQTSILLSNLPEWRKLQNVTSMDSIYYWYYATLALFQAGGKPWETWNEQLKKTLLTQQRRGGCLDGSWDPPKNFWGKIGGRLYATTLSILNLEVYYRYLPIYEGATLNTVEAVIRTIRERKGSEAVRAVRLLGKFGDRKARNFLLELAHGDNHMLALEASVALAKERRPEAVGPLVAQLRSPNQFVRYRALRALTPMIGEGLAPVFIECLRDDKVTVARQAASALRQYANVSFGFEPEAPAAEREVAIEKWRRWWADRQRGAVRVESSPVWLVVSVRPQKGLVAFSTGKPGLVEAGDTYDVYRGNTYVGRVRIVRANGAIAIGEVMEQYTAAEFQEGDVVRPGT